MECCRWVVSAQAQVESAVGDLLLWPIAMNVYDEDPL